MTEPEWLGLPDVDTTAAVGEHCLHHVEQLLLSLQLQLGLQLVCLVEVVLNGALIAPCDEDHFSDARCGRFLDRVLDQRLVDDREHFLGTRLGHGQKTAAEACDRKDGLPQSCLHCLQSLFSRARNSFSFNTGTRSSLAFASLLPGSLPATT